MTTNDPNNSQPKHQKRDDDLRAAYAKAKQEIIERDFPHYAVNEERIPLAQVIEELEEIHRQEAREGRQG